MSHIPQVPGARVIRALQKAGFMLLRQSGSHAILRHRINPNRRAIVPVHGSKSIKPGTLREILRGAGLTVEDLIKLI